MRLGQPSTGPLRVAAVVLLVAAAVLLAVAVADRAPSVGRRRAELYPVAVGATAVAEIVVTFAEAVWFDLRGAVTLSAAGALLVLAGRRRHRVLVARRDDALRRLQRLRATRRR